LVALSGFDTFRDHDQLLTNLMLSKAIKEEIFRLPDQEKRHLIEEIWDSIDQIPSHHHRILKERLETYEVDKTNSISLDEFRQRKEKLDR
jgi:putative addiction module component (TIGR02574 family)